MSIRFSHIVPVSYLDLIKKNKTFWISDKMLKENVEYFNFFKELKDKKRANIFYYLNTNEDSSLQHTIDLAKSINANAVVIPSPPEESVEESEKLANKWLAGLSLSKLRSCYVPRPGFNEAVRFIRTISWGIKNVDYVGISSERCARAFGIEDESNDEAEPPYVDDNYKLQTYLSRWHLFNAVSQLYVNDKMSYQKRFHLIELSGGIREIELLKPFHKYIASCHSGQPFWLSYNKYSYDSSPTGLKYGDINIPFDYNAPYVDDENFNQLIINNMYFADNSAT